MRALTIFLISFLFTALLSLSIATIIPSHMRKTSKAMYSQTKLGPTLENHKLYKRYVPNKTTTELPTLSSNDDVKIAPITEKTKIRCASHRCYVTQ